MGPLATLIGESPAITSLREAIRRLLQRHAESGRIPPILIQGETGTGKGLVARAIHQAGPRADGPFVDVNCAAIPGTLLEAEMFGFERGAFTDARQAKRGLFQAAHHGTIFLDEVGLLPEGLQSKLLKVIEDRTVRRLGSTRAEAVDVSILTATNEDLVAAVRGRRFREDLYHRLAVLNLKLPALRERGEDVLVLAQHFLARACADYDLPPRILTREARAALRAYPWPGNVRELINVMERVALLSEAAEVSAEALGLPEVAPPRDETPVKRDISVTEAVETVERAHLEEALHQTQWNISRAAARLGIPRNTLRYRIEKHGLSPPDLPHPARRVSGERTMAAPATPAPAVPEVVPSVAVRWEPRRLALLGAQVSTRESIEPAPDASRALEILVEKAESFGGRIEELSPTGIVAVFGLDPAEDSPSRAALAALAVQKALERMRQQGSDGLTVRIGIHVGHFLVGRAGGPPAIDLDAKRQAWTILTELVAGAEPGTTRVSGAAAPFLDRRFDLVTLAGVPGAPPATFRLTGRERTGLGLGKTVVPFVGRRHDLELLEGRLGASVSGQGQVVGIVGEAGMGKSRLLFEFREGLAAQPVTYVEGHCASYGSTIPYLPVLDLLRNVCGIADLDHPAAIGEKVRAALRRLGMDPDDAAPYLLHLLGVKEGAERVGGMNPEAIKPRTFEVLGQMCLKASRQQPLVLAVENLHWIDTTSEEYFGALVDSLAGAPILFLATYRPGYRPPWMDKSYATQMALRPLSPGDSLSVVRAVARTGPLPDEVAQVILGKAEGNPFFLEELVRTVVEERGLGHRGAVPDTIQEVLLARIDRLSREARHLLQTASVLGRDVSLRLLRALWEEPNTLGAPLRELTRLEFLYERSGLDEPGYVFKHALIQEVAYGSLTESRRRRHHASAARALEEQYGGRRHEVIEMLAHHYGLSGEGEKAVDYAILAAEKAQRRWANPEALAHFEAALARLDTMPDTPPNLVRRIDAVVSQAEVKFALGRHAEHIQALEGIRHLVAAVADPRRQAAWYYWTGFLHSLTGGRPDVAIGYCRQAAAIAETGGFEEIRAYAECCLAQVSAFAGDLRVALEAGERALTIFEARGDPWWACRALGVLSMTANSLGEWGRSLDYCQRARAHAEAMNDLRRRVVAWWQTAWTHVLRGDPRAGLDCCDEALALSPTRFDAAMTTAARGYGLVKAGEVAAGVVALTDAVGWFQRSRLGYSRLTCAVWLGDGYLRLGERGQARLLLEDVLAGSLELGYRRIEGSARRLLGELLAPEDRLAAARELEAATGVLGEIGARDELAKALVTQAALRRAEGDTPTARQLLERALRLFEASGTVDQPARVRDLLADLPA